MTPQREYAFSIVGEVDFGKSTLLGQILMISQSLPESKIQEVRKFCLTEGREFEPAYLLDAFEIERSQEFTLDYTMALYKWRQKLFRVFDTPGHREFLHKMLSGSLQAPWFLVIIDVNQALTPQNIRHCELLFRMGINRCGVVINKMDTVGNLDTPFQNLEKNVRQQLQKLGLQVDFCLPISAKYAQGIEKLLDQIETSLQNVSPKKEASFFYIQGQSPTGKAWISEGVSWGSQGELLRKSGEKVATSFSAVEVQSLNLPEKFERGDLLVADSAQYYFSDHFLADCFFWREKCGPLRLQMIHQEEQILQIKSTEQNIFKICLSSSLWFSKMKENSDVGGFLIHDQTGPCGGGVIVDVN